MKKLNELPASGLLPVQVSNEIATVDSRLIAEKLGIEHKNLIELIQTHKEIIERDFGVVTFQTEAVKKEGQRGTKYLKYYNLTEDQSLFITTLARNSKEAVELKSLITRSFIYCRRQSTEGTPAVHRKKPLPENNPLVAITGGNEFILPIYFIKKYIGRDKLTITMEYDKKGVYLNDLQYCTHLISNAMVTHNK